MAMLRMPHPRVQVIKRSEGRSAVAAAAYRFGEKLFDERLGKTFDYTRKDKIQHTEMSLPEGASNRFMDRKFLYNKIEAGEKRKDAQVGREFMGPLPRDGMSLDQHIKLVRGFVAEHFTSQGMIADWAIHEGISSNGQRNPHVHILLTMREAEGEEFSAKKNTNWNHKNTLKNWRDGWGEHINAALEEAGSSDWVSFRSYKELGINQEPTIHLGHKASALEERGIHTDLGNHNRRVRTINKVRQAVGSIPPALMHQNAMAADRSDLTQAHLHSDKQPHERALLQKVRNHAKGLDVELMGNPYYISQDDIEAQQQPGEIRENDQASFWQSYVTDSEQYASERGDNEPER